MTFAFRASGSRLSGLQSFKGFRALRVYRAVRV